MATPGAARIAAGKLKVVFTPLTGAQANGSALTTPKYTANCSSRNGGVVASRHGSCQPHRRRGLDAGQDLHLRREGPQRRGYGALSAPSAARVA